MAELPAYLRGFNRPTADAATSGLAGALPPHISIKGNAFTLIDGTGEKRTLQTTYMDVCFVDVNAATSKQYYEHEWEPGNNDPPTCFSHDGIVPSNESQQKQARTCDECEWNVRGSATSKLTGTAIKACRDEKITAITIPSIAVGVDLWQLRITPGSFKAWKAFTERCKQHGFPDICALLVRVQFEAGKNGVLTFTPTGMIDETVAKLVHQAREGASDSIVGRGVTALPPPATPPFQPSPVPFAAPSSLAPATAAAVSPSSPGRRPRRTKAEMEQARAGAAQPAGAPVAAPFVPQPPPNPPTTGPAPVAGAPFGIAPPTGPAPGPAVAAIDSFFGK